MAATMDGLLQPFASPHHADRSACPAGCPHCVASKPAQLACSKSALDFTAAARYQHYQNHAAAAAAAATAASSSAYSAFQDPFAAYAKRAHCSQPDQRQFSLLNQSRSFDSSYYPGYYSVPAAPQPPRHDVPEQQPEQQPEQPVESAEETDKPQGGVSERLDYNMDVMADFVTLCATGLYSMAKSGHMADVDIVHTLKRTRASSCNPDFRQWVHNVLVATRLPSPTIMYALQYMTIRLRDLREDAHGLPDTHIYNFLTPALLLGSKFNDDNTFMNGSWASVTGLELATVNLLEATWLKAFGFHLFFSHEDQAGLGAWYSFHKEYVASHSKTAPPAKPAHQLPPIHTSFGWPSYTTEPSPLPSPPVSACSDAGARSLPQSPPDSAVWSAGGSVAGSARGWGSTGSLSTIPSPTSSTYAPGPTTPEQHGPSVDVNLWTSPDSYRHPYSASAYPRSSFDSCAGRFSLPAQSASCAPCAFPGAHYGSLFGYSGPVLVSPAARW